MIPGLRPPEGFVARDSDKGTLLVATVHGAAIAAAGLDDPHRWAGHLEGVAAGAPGRGQTVRLELASGPRVLLKKMRRGGLTRALWRDRFLGSRRLLDNLRVPLEAARRGVATPAPVALLLVRGPACLHRGWLAVEEVPDTADLASRVAAGKPIADDELSAVARLVRRMHDAGLEHRDLNLGNLLLRAGPGGGCESFVIDLDGARLHDGPLPFRLRQRGLRRLERSYVKLCGGGVAAGGIGHDPWYEWYAAGDPRLAEKLERGRAVGRFWLRVHRLGWPSQQR